MKRENSVILYTKKVSVQITKLGIYKLDFSRNKKECIKTPNKYKYKIVLRTQSCKYEYFLYGSHFLNFIQKKENFQQFESALTLSKILKNQKICLIKKNKESSTGISLKT